MWLISLFFYILILFSPSHAQTQKPFEYSVKSFNSSHKDALIDLGNATFEYSVKYFNSSHYDRLIDLGNATIDSTGALQVTPDSIYDMSLRLNKSGRFMMRRPFKIWEEDPSPTTSSQNNTKSSENDVVASFNSTFVVNFFVPANETSGEGFTFLIAPDLSEPPLNSHGEWLGLTNATLNGDPSQKFVAIEFDTKKQAYDVDDNHIGLNINDVVSSKYVPLTFPLAPVNVPIKYRVWVHYNGTSKLLEVYITEQNMSRPSRPVLNETINLKDYVNQHSYLGFSASTGDSGRQLNCVLEWELSMQILAEKEIPEKRDTKKKSVWGKVGVGVGVVALALIAIVVVGVLYRSKRNRAVNDLSVVRELTMLPGMPKEFAFKDLKQATNSFDEKMKLGQGGYGVVYKGVLVKEQTEVAVKMFSRESIKGKSDFLAELSIINCLRHKHLVRLIGWCHKNGMLLLVYEYMPNGSLDHHLFGGPDKFLNWATRYNIISNLASALHYLHNEYNQMVIHRDIKSSNILLNCDYNACLGDFGLARALEHGRTSFAEFEGVAGTFGYIAPETFHTGKGTRESDIYAFGAVVLEIVCGHRPSTILSGSLVLLDWVWKLYREGRILETVDERLEGDVVSEEAKRLLLLGLACSHPLASERPNAMRIVQILSGTAPVPNVPHFKPYFMWPVVGSVTDSTTSNITADNTPVTFSYDGEAPEDLSKDNSMARINVSIES